ncbi:MAG: hypothetical protein EAY75_16545 [Bacteroidetes bacterium]|nr:MAG: hypothetical protein EAY75_16545 [Bacteroidota bacterium]
MFNRTSSCNRSTSLPEIATAALAASRKNTHIAIGCAAGSNISKIFGVSGPSRVIKPLPFQPSENLDFAMTISSSMILFANLFLGKKYLVQK